MRKERASIREKLKAGRMSFREVLNLSEDGSAVASRMRVKHVISAMPGYGLTKTQRLMKELHIAEVTRVKGLGVRQRQALMEVFGC